MSDRWAEVRRHAFETRRLVDEKRLSGLALVRAAIKAKDLTVIACLPGDPALRAAKGVYDGGYILVDSSLGPADLAWVLAHELGHAILHVTQCTCHAADLDVAPVPAPLRYGAEKVDTYHPKRLQELAANVFAAALLLPLHQMRERFIAGDTFEAIAADSGVSETATLHALAQALLNLPEPDSGPTMPGILPLLDASQEVAACVESGPVLINAGPGTGKTRTLVARIQHLLGQGVSPTNILAVTFSNRAAAEMRERIRIAEPAAASGVTISTFHGLCLELLRRYHDRVGLPADFTIIDDLDAVALLERNVGDLPLDEHRLLSHPGRALREIVSAIGTAKDELASPERYAELAEQVSETSQSVSDAASLPRWLEVARVYAVYERLMRELGVIDYGGLILSSVQVLQHDPDALTALRAEFRHILVDEYQDMNRASGYLLRLLAGTGEGLWVVGDLRQSIYRFRGAAPENILNFASDFPGARTMDLEVNYRSDPAVVSLIGAASGIVSGTSGTQSWQAHRDAESGSRIVSAVAPDPESEAQAIAATIQDRVSRGMRARSRCPG